MGVRATAARAGLVLVSLLATVTFSTAVAAAGTYTGFGVPRAVTILGYTGSAMEPFISADGESLLFNTSNVPPNVPSLQLATRVGDDTFEYRGPLGGEGVNEPGVLSGTPTLDDQGNLYFVSTRSYGETLATIYSGQLTAEGVTRLALASGISGGTPGIVDFDVSVSPDGSELYVSVGHFNEAGSIMSAGLMAFAKSGAGFVAEPDSAGLLRAIDKPKSLNYAASVSRDGLELFFTRATPAKGAKGKPAIYRATRTRSSKPFGHVQRVAAISGYAEAPSLSGDGRTLYFHELVGAAFQIEAVTRP